MTARKLPILVCCTLIAASHFLVNSAFAVVTLVDVTITSSESDPTTANPIPINFAFGEAVSGFDQTDIVVTNGAVTNFTGAGDTYDAEITPVAPGLVQVDIAEGAGTGDGTMDDTEADTFSINYTLVPPTPVVPGSGIPDLRVGNKSAASSHKGDNNYQKVSYKEARIKGSTSFFVSLQNDGSAGDTFTMRSRKSRNFKVSYKALGGGNITGALAAGRYTAKLGSGGIQNIKSTVKPKSKSFRTQKFKDVITATAQTSGGNDIAKICLKFLPILKPEDLLNPSAAGPGINP